MKIKLKKSKNTKLQKGGSSNHLTIQDYDKAITKLTELDYINIKSLFEETFELNKIKFKFNSYLRDNFIQGNSLNHDSNYYHEWYKGINPNFEIISKLKSTDENGNETDFRLPEFKIFIANLAKDIMMMLLHKKYNKSNETENNKKKYLAEINKIINNAEYYNRNDILKQKYTNNENINENQNDGYNANDENNENKKSRIKKISYKNSIYTTKFKKTKKQYLKQVINEKITYKKDILINLLKDINDIIGLKYIYTQVQDLYLKFIKFVSVEKSRCNKYIKEIREIYEKTPYIVYPSYWILDFKEIINLCSTPILNFKYMDRRRKVHFDFYDPCSQIDHDVIFHGNLSHNYKYYLYYYQNYQNENKFKKNFKEIFIKYFENMNNILNKLKPFYDYSESKAKVLELKKEKKDKLNYNDNDYYDYLDSDSYLEFKKLCFGIILFYVLHEHGEDNVIGDFINYNLFIQFTDIEKQKIDNTDDPNSPSQKYKILKIINWKSVYDGLNLVINKEVNNNNIKIRDIL